MALPKYSRYSGLVAYLAFLFPEMTNKLMKNAD